MRSANVRSDSACVASGTRRPIRARTAAYWPRSRLSCSLPSKRSTAEGSDRWCGVSSVSATNVSSGATPPPSDSVSAADCSSVDRPASDSGSAVRSKTRTNRRAGPLSGSRRRAGGWSGGSDAGSTTGVGETLGGDGAGEAGTTWPAGWIGGRDAGAGSAARRVAVRRGGRSGSGVSTSGGLAARIFGQSNSTPGC